mmetsp:Transcript_21518/g.43205  ORF Transcript_21518/g.43205 Transcript_21518/m.43205 type:complete len:439 (-) Transcript_21518:63-1379(-)
MSDKKQLLDRSSNTTDDLMHVQNPEDIIIVPPEDRQHWVFASFMAVGYILGTGVLVLPSAMANLGYFLGLVTCITFAFLSTYVGLLLGRLRNNFHPECLSYKMLSRKCVGPQFERGLEFLTCINWFMSMALYILTAVKSFQAAFYWTHVCGYYWGLICVALMTPCMLIRNLKTMEWMAAISDGAAILIIIVVLTLLAAQDEDSPSSHTHYIWPPKESFLEAYNPISSFIFAYQGQSIFLEIMAEMRDPKEWPKSVFLSHFLMASCYGATAVIGYYYKGNDVPAFLPDGLKNGAGKTVVNLLVAYHVLVAYIINNVPLVAMLKRRYMSGADTPLQKHFGLSMVLLLSSYLMTNLIPFFEDMVSIIGAMCGAPLMLGLPPMFYYYSLRERGLKMGTFDRVICSLLFFVIFPFTFASGMVAAFKSLVDNWRENGPPFTCMS